MTDKTIPLSRLKDLADGYEESCGMAAYNVSADFMCEALSGDDPSERHSPLSWNELPKQDRELHRLYARAVLKTFVAKIDE